MVYTGILGAISDTTTIRVSRTTRDVLNRLAAHRGQSMVETVERAARLLQQETIGADLATPLRADEIEWLDADAG